MGLAALALSCITASAFADTSWGPEEQLTNSSQSARNGAEAVGPAGTLHMLTVDDRTGIPHVFYQRKPDGEAGWSAQTVLSFESDGSVQAGYNCALCTDGNRGVYAVWEEYYNGNSSLYFRRSTDDGATWGDRVLVAAPDAATVNAVCPNIAVDQVGTLHLVWLMVPLSGSQGRLFYRKGAADGKTLSTPMNLRSGSAVVSSPGVAVGSRSLLAYFQENVGGYEQVRYLRSTDCGDHWSDAQTLSRAGLYCRQPKLVFDGQENFYSIWTQGAGSGADTVVFRYSDHDTGLIADVAVCSGSGGEVSAPAVAVRDNRVTAAWVVNNAGNVQMSMKTSGDKGATWGAESGTAVGNDVKQPCLVDDRGNVHLFYGYVPAVLGASAYQVRHLIRDDATPPAPVIVSGTHPIFEKSGNNRPEFVWSGTDNPGGIGLAGYAVAFDSRPDTDPGSVTTCALAQNRAAFDDLDNQVYYLHVRSIDRIGNAGAAAHYAVRIDNNSFCPGDQAWVAPSPVRDGRLRLRFFLAEPADVTLELFDAIGRKLGGRNLAGHSGVNTVEMDIGDWVNGTYFFRLSARAQAKGQVAVIAKPWAVVR